ncbi:calcium uniporter protein, mitochondrial-like [Anneissia japonica]|uniref:calcium uniporter protein, mitochondrial-like n=1 Tax=Anneissia japonica TaxID=1529436 RepID=UPI001425A86E|nr:calcium uniporter protein, mitochondrial-like [Anneissia japonica]
MAGRRILRDICFRVHSPIQVLLKDTSVTPFRISSALYCTSANQGVVCEYRNGLPVLLVPLPSRQELCQFTLKPITENVGDFMNHIKCEDGGVETVAVYNNDGIKVAKSTSIDVLMKENFKLKINERSFEVSPPEAGILLKSELDIRAAKRTNLVIWGGLGYMALQFGLLARLTWWEYSWDIVEPITYFVTYGSAMALYSYYVLTKQDYSNPAAADRQYLIFFHRFAKRKQLDIAAYNNLKEKVAQVEQDLRRLRDPLALHLPITPPLPPVKE